VYAMFEFRSADRVVCRFNSEWAIHSVKSGQRLREIARARNLRHASACSDADSLFFDSARIQPVFPAERPLLNPNLRVDQSGRKFAATLEIELDNLFFFDHQNDHVPGMLILEGMRELAIDVALRFPCQQEGQPRIVGIDVNFMQFAELDYSMVLVAEIEQLTGQEASIHVTTLQFDKPVAKGGFIIG
jgi:3-hydroxymyristoyl/3-hydroxydecanoyl-(acyl carrier protein) dehydratase